MILSHMKVVTRKQHECWGCCEVFPKGTPMHRVVNKDGRLLTTYWCVPCQDFIDEAVKRDRYLADDGFDQGWVRDTKAEIEEWEKRMNSDTKEASK